ncbi:unnamed protein product [Sphagnum troendelagicum]
MRAMSTSAVQQLYDICKATFCSGGGGGASDLPSSPIALERVRLALENITSLDVGLDEEEQQQHEELDLGFFGSNDGETEPDLSMVVKCPPLPISYLPLYECEQFAMGIFCLPKSTAIPLHNHPGMTVLSKVLYGSVRVRGYDWVNPFDEMLNADPSRRRLAKREVDHVLTAPCETSVLYPTTGGNIHAFTALTPCALFDVLAPPYSRASGRKCTYYHNIPKGVFPVETEELQVDGDTPINDSCYDWLEGFELPKDYKVERVEYRGLKVAP